MTNPHTADLATRYRYRQEGAEMERERIIKLLDKYLGTLDYDDLIELIRGAR